jgi:glucokinase
MIRLARHVLGTDRPEAVGVSFGGHVHVDGRTVLRSLHVEGWDGRALAGELEDVFDVPVFVLNDGNAGAWGEHCVGSGQGVSTFAYLTVSTGIGGGVVVDGVLHRGERGMAGEFGHVVVVPDGPQCTCGRAGCLEALAAGPAIVRALSRNSRGARRGDGPRLASDVAIAARRGDTAASEVWSQAMRWIGLGIASIVNVLDPGRVAIGGGVTEAADLFFDPVREVVADRALRAPVDVVPASLGSDACLIGAALWALHDAHV